LFYNELFLIQKRKRKEILYKFGKKVKNKTKQNKVEERGGGEGGGQ
jgi:hypothetical protein